MVETDSSSTRRRFRGLVRVGVGLFLFLAALVAWWVVRGQDDRTARERVIDTVGPSRQSATAAVAAPAEAATSSSFSRSNRRDETATPPVAAALPDPGDPYARLLYLHYNGDKRIAVVNHDGERPRRTLFIQVGDDLIDGTVTDVGPDEIVVRRRDGSQKHIPYLGIAEAAAPIERPFETSAVKLARVFSPGYDHAKEAEVHALIEQRTAARRARRGRGGGRGDGSGGGRARRARRHGEAGAADLRGGRGRRRARRQRSAE